jgi:hypothetical protein
VGPGYYGEGKPRQAVQLVVQYTREGRRLPNHAKKERAMRRGKQGIFIAFLILVSVMAWLFVPSQAGHAQSPKAPEGDLSKWATVEAHDNGVPVYAFGYTYVYGVSPDIRPGVVLQEGNDAPAKKIQPKKSWEIKNNLFGSTPAREPRTAANDDQPLLGVHLIDGDARSCWASRGQNQADVEPAWIRIDLPAEAMVGRVVLVGHPEGMGGAEAQFGEPAVEQKVGQAFPRKLEIRLSRDAWRWATVYRTDSYTPHDPAGRNEIKFDQEVAKQIWIIGSDLPLTHYYGHSFSIAGVEVLDQDGKNVALISRGAGVQVSSTHTGFGMDRYTQDNLWPTQYDLGFKWVRVGYDMSWLQWQYVERAKGKLKVDERTEAAVTEAGEKGLSVVMTLDKGNWLYTTPPRFLDRTRDLMETYSTYPPTPQGWQNVLLDQPAVFEGYLNYIRFMVRHFKDRVKIFEVWNEWNPYTYEEGKRYAKVLRAAVKVIREEYPEAKIMPASPGWMIRDNHAFLRALGEEGLLSQVDVIGFHPFYNTSPVHPAVLSFPEAFPRFKKMMEGYGFKGEYMATEWDYFCAYPVSDVEDYWNMPAYSELEKAIYSTRMSIMFANLGIPNFWNETFQTMQTMRGLSLFRNQFSNEVVCPTQPEPVYYMFRTLSTALEDVKGAVIPVSFSDQRRSVDSYGFTRSNGEKLVAFWLSGLMEEPAGNAGVLATDILIKGVKGEGATIIDTLNGTEKALKVERTSEGVTLRKIHVQNWPLIVRLPN